jgi:hypothetical protein
MPLIPNVPFADGTPYTAEIAYLAFNQVFDDNTGYLGHKPRVVDTDLSNTAGQLKDRVDQATNSLVVTVFSGLTLAYRAGSVLLPTGVTVTIAAGQIVAPNNATSYVYVDTTGIVAVTTTLPVFRALMAVVTTVSGTVTSLVDNRQVSIQPVAPIAQAIKVFGGTNTTNKTAVNAEVFSSGTYYYKDFTVPSGVTITVDKLAKFYCSGNVLIQGTVNVSTWSNGARSIVAVTTGIGISGGTSGGSPGSGAPNNSYPWGALPYGSGGSHGYALGSPANTTTATASITFSSAGYGGGGLQIEAAGTISVTGTISVKGGDAEQPVIETGFARVSGNGGGSGGLCYLASLKSVTLAASAVIDGRGGNGSNAVRNLTGGETSGVNGGSGGGGGYIVLASPSINTTGSTLLLTGGAIGTSAGATGTIGGGFGAGYGGNGGGNSGGTNLPGSVGQLVLLNFIPVA